MLVVKFGDLGFHMKKLATTILFTSALFLLLSVRPVMAQQTTLSISPPILEVFIKPGKSILVAYTLQNISDPVIIKAKILPFEPAGNLGNISIKDEFEGPIRFNLDNSDIKLEQSFFLKSLGLQQLLLRVRVPEGTPNGDYYYTLLAETEPPPGIEGNINSRTKTTIGSNILITVTDNGDVDLRGKIAMLDVVPRFNLNILGKSIKFFDSNDKIPVVLVMENKGVNFIKPEGEITLRGSFGETSNYEIIPQNVLSQSQRLLSASPSAELRKATSLVIPGFFLGKYNLNATINLGKNGSTLFATTSFIALPFRFMILLLIVVIIVFLIIKKTSNNEVE